MKKRTSEREQIAAINAETAVKEASTNADFMVTTIKALQANLDRQLKAKTKKSELSNVHLENDALDFASKLQHLINSLDEEGWLDIEHATGGDL